MKLRLLMFMGLVLLIVPSLATTAPEVEYNPDPQPVVVEPQVDRVDLINESFEGPWPPDGWQMISHGDGWDWNRSSQEHRTGYFSAYVPNSPPNLVADEWFVLSTTFATLAGPTLSWYETESNWQERGEHHYIMVSTTSATDADAFDTVLDMTPTNHPITGFDGEPVVVDLSAYAGEPVVHIAWRYTGEFADWWYIDDVRIFELLEADIEAVTALPSGEYFAGGESFTPMATYQNNGYETESFSTTMEIYASETLVYSETVEVSDLASADLVDVSYPDFTAEDGFLYEVRANCYLPGDLNTNNDSYSAYNNSYTQQRIPIGLLFTNSGCAPCVPSNQVCDQYTASEGDDVALIRIHVWWPNPNDIMYLYNTEQSQELTGEYEVNGVPNFFMDGNIDLGSSGGSIVPAYEERKLVPSPNSIELFYIVADERLVVEIDNVELLPPTEFRLLAAITEDDIHHNGGNGEPVHNQAMRHYYPDTFGTAPVPTALGEHTIVLDTPWGQPLEYDNLRATVYILDVETNRALQARTRFLTEIETIVLPVGDQMVKAIQLDAAYPNPFNPSTTISFRLARSENVELAIFAIDGTRVATLINDVVGEGPHSVTWNGTDDSGQQVASGTYFYRLLTEGYSETRQMTMIK